MPHPLSVRFDGCVARIGRSREHLKTLTDEIASIEAAARRGDIHSVTGDKDSVPGYDISRLKILKPLPLARWGILVGDVVHQARAALDNLIELLNIREMGHPLPKTYFPVYKDRDTYLYGALRKNGKRSGPGFQKAGKVGRDAAALIESFQPYHRGDDYVRDPLWVLHGLWIMDKHHNTAIVAIGARVDDARPLFRTTDGGPITVYGMPEIIAPRSFPIEDGAEIVRIRIRHGPNTEVAVEHDITLGILLGEGQPGERSYLISKLHECIKRADEILGAFAPFFRDPNCACW